MGINASYGEGTKLKNLQNKACLPSLICYLLCPRYFAGDFPAFSLWDTVH